MTLGAASPPVAAQQVVKTGVSLPEGTAFAKKFKQGFGGAPLTPFAYDCAWVAIDAMKRADPE
ncbi:hypothetical protein PSAC2689_180034 [Paraburkholderia sacchari]